MRFSFLHWISLRRHTLDLVDKIQIPSVRLFDYIYYFVSLRRLQENAKYRFTQKQLVHRTRYIFVLFPCVKGNLPTKEEYVW